MLKKYHVGEFINEYMKVLEISETELSKGSGVSRSHLSNIRLCKKDLNVDIANKISEMLNVNSSLLLNIQNDYMIYKKRESWILENNKTYTIISERIKELFSSNENVSIEDYNLFLTSKKEFATIRGFNYYEPSKSSDIKNYIIMKAIEGANTSINPLDRDSLSNFVNGDFVKKIAKVNNIAEANALLEMVSSKLYEFGINLEISKSKLNTTIKGITKINKAGAKIFIENSGSFVDVIWYLTHELMHIIHPNVREEHNINRFAEILLANKFSKVINSINNEEFIFENKDKMKDVNPFIFASIWRFKKKKHIKKERYDIKGETNDIFYT